MFGRDRERAELKAAIQDADTPVVRIVGPSGAGKTALVEAVLAEMGRGLLVGTPISDRPYGLRDFTVRDPAGFEIRFAQPMQSQ